MAMDWKVLQSRIPRIVEALGKMMSDDMDLLISQEGKVELSPPSTALDYRQQDGTRFTIRLSIEVDEKSAIDWDEPRK